jgi:hypothetical protein
MTADGKDHASRPVCATCGTHGLLMTRWYLFGTGDHSTWRCAAHPPDIFAGVPVQFAGIMAGEQ